jgi:hypothetical protein
VALQGNGRLSGGFKGRVALASPRLVPGRCAATNLRANVAVAVTARRPSIEGPVTLERFRCPASNFDITAPRFDASATFNEAFTSIDGRGRMAIGTLVAGANGLSAFTGDLTFKGSSGEVRGACACPRASRAWGPSLPSARSFVVATVWGLRRARSRWSAILPPTARRSISRCLPA